MGSKPELEPELNSTRPQLQLTSLPYLKSQQKQHYSGALTPLHTSASVPFSWEQEPGKPLPCLTLTLQSSHLNDIKCLDLPPRLLYEAKTPSPTTVLEGPYSLGRSILGSSSFRFLRKRQKSFDGAISYAGSAGSSPERGLLSERKDKGLFGSWRKKGGINIEGRSEADESSCIISSISDDGIGSGSGSGYDGGVTVEVERVGRKRRQLGSSKLRSHFWASIYGTFRQVIYRRHNK